MSSAEYGLVSEDNADFRQVSASLTLAALTTRRAHMERQRQRPEGSRV